MPQKGVRVSNCLGRVPVKTALISQRLDHIDPFVGRFEIGEEIIQLWSPSPVGQIMNVAQTHDFELMRIAAAAAAGVERRAWIVFQELLDVLSETTVPPFDHRGRPRRFATGNCPRRPLCCP